MILKAMPVSLQEANAYVDAIHRHHNPVVRDKFRVGVGINGELHGVAQVGRPVSRIIDSEGDVLEVVRLCTDGTKNACSFLYSRCARIAKEMGYRKIITYILDTEDGASLKAAGWTKAADIRGKNWSTPSRPRDTKAPTCNKQRWEKEL